MSRYAREISDYQLSDYQQAVRALLKTPFVTASYPDHKTIGRVRRFSETLAIDLREAFGNQLVLRGDTARLLRVKDRLDPGQPARTRTGRAFDRRREPWRMSAEEYQSGAKGIVLRGNRIEAPWDRRLSELMVASGRAVMEESLLELLLQDLGQNRARTELR